MLVLEKEIEIAAQSGKVPNELLAFGTELFPVLVQFLTSDLSIETLEKYERVLKAVLRWFLLAPVSGERARELAQFQKDLQFLLKYKSYAVKASSPLGFSIFLQNDAEGFSFQQHTDYKVEVFHILKTSPGAFIFVCDFSNWTRVFNESSFRRWLAGESNTDYEQFVYRPMPGDVVVIDRLRIVHTVVGCVLEEYATVSTDMVDRLFDQNAGKYIPDHFNRSFASAALRSLPSPESNQRVRRTASGWMSEVIVPKVSAGWSEIDLATIGSLSASRLSVFPRKSTSFLSDDDCATSLFVAKGNGSMLILGREEIGRYTPSPIDLSVGDVIMIPAGVCYQVTNESIAPLVISLHRIPPTLALMEV